MAQINHRIQKRHVINPSAAAVSKKKKDKKSLGNSRSRSKNKHREFVLRVPHVLGVAFVLVLIVCVGHGHLRWPFSLLPRILNTSQPRQYWGPPLLLSHPNNRTRVITNDPGTLGPPHVLLEEGHNDPKHDVWKATASPVDHEIVLAFGIPFQLFRIILDWDAAAKATHVQWEAATDQVHWFPLYDFSGSSDTNRLKLTNETSVRSDVPYTYHVVQTWEPSHPTDDKYWIPHNLLYLKLRIKYDEAMPQPALWQIKVHGWPLFLDNTNGKTLANTNNVATANLLLEHTSVLRRRQVYTRPPTPPPIPPPQHQQSEQQPKPQVRYSYAPQPKQPSLKERLEAQAQAQQAAAKNVDVTKLGLNPVKLEAMRNAGRSDQVDKLIQQKIQEYAQKNGGKLPS